MTWRQEAACKDAYRTNPLIRLHFSEDDDGPGTRAIKSYCAQCPVTTECLDAGISNNEIGVWGGLSTRERRRIKSLSQRVRRKFVNADTEGRERVVASIVAGGRFN